MKKNKLKFVKFGRLNSPDHLLFIADETGVNPVIECEISKDGIQYVFKTPCPFCGKFHRHGVGEGFRIPHCHMNARAAMVLRMFKLTDETSTEYYVVNSDEYRRHWKRAVNGDYLSASDIRDKNYL